MYTVLANSIACIALHDLSEFLNYSYSIYLIYLYTSIYGISKASHNIRVFEDENS